MYAFVAALVVVAALLGGGLLSIGPPDFDPTTKILHDKERGLAVHGSWDDPSVPGRRQLLDAPSYITTWKDTGQSEGIIIQAQLCLDFSGAFLKNGHVKLYTSSGQGWQEVKDAVVELPSVTGFSGCKEWTKAVQYFLSGEFNGWFRAEMYAELWDVGPNVFDGNPTHDLIFSGPWIRDDAVIASGRGTIVSPKELQVFEVGQTIPVTVDLGSSQSHKISSTGQISTASGYTLELFSEAQGRTVKTWDLASGPGTFSVDATGAKLEYTVLADDFLSVGECRNTLSLKLLNDLFLKDQTDLKTIDIAGRAPGKPTIEVTTLNEIWEEGNPITVKVVTEHTDALVNIVAEYRETGLRVLKENRVAQLEFTFTPPTDGVLIVTVSVEVDCRASDPVDFTVVLKNKEPPSYKETGFGFPFWAIMLIVAIALILIAAFVPLPIWPYRVVIVLLSVIFFTLTVVFFG